ncbi:hypothetical protein INT47_013171 [Mucor saturninus]|uniref:Uncharacterized protein n=1 Tax=Mucor saturninus TaxID=64648 RepID=A0A8H7QV90_9FUNG|nr:hypothetical protein INT47_013171 [Mucor saturninus]
MGSSISKSKIFDMPKGEHRCSTTSSQRTMVADEPPKTNNKKPFIKPKFFRNKQSLAKRKHYKRKSVVTKSIIGRPTNFKHLNSSTHMDNEDESAKIAAQMLILSSLIKPLPKDGNIPIIPPRSSSYSNHIIVKDFHATSIKKRKPVAGMKKNSLPRTARRQPKSTLNKIS